MSRPTFATVRNRTVLTVAASAAALGTQQADASILYTPANETVNAANPSVGIDFDHNASIDVAVTYNPTSGLALTKQTSDFPGYVTDHGNSTIVQALSAGDVISDSPPLSALFDVSPPNAPIDGTINNGAGTGYFTAAAGEKYIGVTFSPISDLSTIAFGWISFRVDDDSSLANLSGTITGYAYETSGGRIDAGDIPEPSSLGLLAMGATALAAYRRRTR